MRYPCRIHPLRVGAVAGSDTLRRLLLPLLGLLACLAPVLAQASEAVGLLAETGIAAVDPDKLPESSRARFSRVRDPIVGASGIVAFQADLSGPGVVSTNSESLWAGRPDGDIRLIAREGDPVPGVDGAVFNDFVVYRKIVSAVGSVAFMARIRGTGITNGNNRVVMEEHAGGLRLIARGGSGTCTGLYNFTYTNTAEHGPHFAVHYADQASCGEALSAGSPGNLQVIAVEDQPLVFADCSVRDLLQFNSNASGQVVYRATLDNDVFGADCPDSIYRWNGQESEVVVSRGEPITGLPVFQGEPTRFGAFSYAANAINPVINALGEVLFAGTITIPAHQSTFTEQALWVKSPGLAPKLALLTQHAIPEVNSAVSSIGINQFALADNGEVVVTVSYTNLADRTERTILKGFPTPTFNYPVRGEYGDSPLSVVARLGQSVNGSTSTPGEITDLVSHAQINASGGIAVSVEVDGRDAAVRSSSNGLEQVLRELDTVTIDGIDRPVVQISSLTNAGPSGGNATGSGLPTSFNDSGVLAIEADLDLPDNSETTAALVVPYIAAPPTLTVYLAFDVPAPRKFVVVPVIPATVAGWFDAAEANVTSYVLGSTAPAQFLPGVPERIIDNARLIARQQRLDIRFVHGAPPGGELPDNSVIAYFLPKLEGADTLGMAYEGKKVAGVATALVDTFNKNPRGAVAIFGASPTGVGSFGTNGQDAKQAAETLLHEVGHTLGLVHINPLQGYNGGYEIMDYEEPRSSVTEEFYAEPAIAYAKPLDGEDDVLPYTQNPLYHLLRYTFNKPYAQLQPGSRDVAATSTLEVALDLGGVVGFQLTNMFAVFGNTASSDRSLGSSISSVTPLGSFDPQNRETLRFAVPNGENYLVVGSNRADGAVNLVLGTGTQGAPGIRLNASGPGEFAGRVFELSENSNSVNDVGSFDATVRVAEVLSPNEGAIDSDNDGLSDEVELLLGTNPGNPDTDNDGLTDGQEVAFDGKDDFDVSTDLNPLAADTDGDGLDDGDEIDTHNTNPLLADSDGDSFDDGAEIAAGSDPNDPASTPSITVGKLQLAVTAIGSSPGSVSALLDELANGSQDLATKWRSADGKANAWFTVDAGQPSVLTELRLAPRGDRDYRFEIRVSDVLVNGQASSGAVTECEWPGDGVKFPTALTPCSLPAMTGRYLTVSLLNRSSVTVHGIELIGELPTAPNLPPVAGFEITSTAGNPNISVDAAASADPDGTIVSYAWNFGDGSSAAGLSATHTFVGAGTYTVSLQITDNLGATDSASQEVTISLPGNQPPQAAFEATPRVDSRTVDFDASASTDPDGTINSYSWNFGDGSSGAGESPSHTYAADGTYLVTLAVTDNNGATGNAMRSVVVGVNAAPVASFNATQRAGTLTVDLDASGSSDSDGNIVNYSWEFGDGSGTVGGPVNSHTFGSAGTYTITLTVVDDKGAAHTTEQSITLETTGGQEIILLERLNLSGVAGDKIRNDFLVPAGATELRVRITGGSGNADLYVRVGTKPTQSNYDCRPFLTDNEEVCVVEQPSSQESYFYMIRGRSAFSGVTLTVSYLTGSSSNQAPSAAFDASVRENTRTIDVDASASTDPDGMLNSYEWDYGDGNTGSGSLASHTYAADGTYLVELTVTDDDGASASATEAVIVTENSGGNEVVLLEESGIARAITKKLRRSFSLPADATGLQVTLTGGAGNADLYVREGDRATASQFDCASLQPGNMESCVLSEPDTSSVYHLLIVATEAFSGVDLRVTYTTGSTTNSPPMALFTASQIAETMDVAFDASTSTDADGDISDFSWQFGDGNSGAGIMPTHSYAEAGSFDVSLTVTDDRGGMDERTETVVVEAIETPPQPIALTVQTNAAGTRPVLMWSGATSNRVDIYLDGSKVKTTANDGEWKDQDNSDLSGRYQVCEKGSTVCSNEAGVGG